MTRILINECHSTGRRIKRARLTLEAAAQRLPATAPPDANLALHDALSSLPEKTRLPFILHYMEGYTISEIAKMLRIPQGTVSTRLRQGKQQLRQTLGDEEVFSHA